MHRIDTPGATPDNRFTEGDPTIPTAATEVSAEWLNAVQEEVAAVIAGAGIALDKADNGQLLEAITTLIANAAPEMPGYATTETPGLVRRATDEDAEAGVGDGYISPPQLAELLGRANVTAAVRDMRAGEIVMWGKATIPTLSDGLPAGLELNGSVVSLATFPRLLRAWVGETDNATAEAFYRCTDAGVRDAAGTHIRLLDMRGVAPRGWDNGRGLDAARVLLSYQADAFASHNHPQSRNSASGSLGSNGCQGTDSNNNGFSSATANSTGYRGDTETRMKNTAVMFIIYV